MFAALVLVVSTAFSEQYVVIDQQAADLITVATLYGTFVVDEPILVELFTCPQMKRLEKIQQLGLYCKHGPVYDFNRYDHSVGVWALVRRFGGSLPEQVAALLHDVSHTAFSHVGGFLFVDCTAPDAAARMDAYQDDEHERYLHESGIAGILHNYGLSVADIYHKNDTFKILEQSLPDLCADRFEYNIQGALWEGLLTRDQADAIIASVRYDHETWYFVDQESARQFALVSMIMTRTIWGSPENYITGIWLAHALRRAINLDIITYDDMRFGSDDVIWSLLERSGDDGILDALKKIKYVRNYFVLNGSDYDQMIVCKFRGVNPLVQTEMGLQRLSEIDHDFAGQYHKIKRIMNTGWPVQNLVGSVA